MNKKQERSFIITNIIINIVAMILIFLVDYFMKDMEMWKLILCLLLIIICSGIINSFNIVYHLRKK